MALGFAIVGTGMISRFHAKALKEVRGAKLVACFDRIGAAAEKFGRETKCKPYSDLKKMLDDDRVDVVSVCTPSGAHLEPAVAAAKAGKHVVVEKPLEITTRRCDRIIDACEKHGVKLATIFPSRFHTSSVALKKAVDAGRFGRMTLGDAYVKWYRPQEYYDSGAWRGTWKLDGGGALMNQAIHAVDLLLWLMGPVAKVQANAGTLAHKRIEVEDVVTAIVTFKSGALGVIEASTAVYPGYLKRIELHGMEGTAVLEEEELVKWDFAKRGRGDAAVRKAMEQANVTGGGASDPSAIGHQAHAKLFKDFVSAVTNDRPPAIDGHEGRRSVELITAIYKSAKSGRAVSVTG